MGIGRFSFYGLFVALLLSGCINTGADGSSADSMAKPGEFAELLNLRSGLNHKIEYRYNYVIDTGFPDKITVYYHSNKARVDSVFEDDYRGEIFQQRALIDFTDNELVSCRTSVYSSSDSMIEWVCTDVSDKASIESFFLFDISENNYNISHDGEKSVASMTGTCFKTKVKNPLRAPLPHPVSYCISQDGIPLYLGFGDSELTATSITMGASVSSFTPPAKIA